MLGSGSSIPSRASPHTTKPRMNVRRMPTTSVNEPTRMVKKVNRADQIPIVSPLLTSLIPSSCFSHSGSTGPELNL